MKALAAVLLILVVAQLFAAVFVFAAASAWIAVDPSAVDQELPGVVIGLCAIAISVLVPYSVIVLSRGRNG